MKNSITILCSFLILNIFTQCASSQFDKKPSFTITKAQHQKWVDANTNSEGTVVTIEFAKNLDTTIQFDSIFFQNKVAATNVKLVDNKTTLSGNFVKSNIADKNIVLHSDPKKEFGNKPPILPEKSPFELEENECVISYIVNNKKHYYKLDELQKGKDIIYP